MGIIEKKKIINRINLVTILMGVIVAIFALLFFYSDSLSFRTENLPAYDTVPPITRDDFYTQELHCTRDGLKEIDLLCATYARNNAGTIVLSFCDSSGNTIQEWAVDASTLPDNGYLQLILDNYIPDSHDKTYYLNVVSDSEEDTAATMYTTTYKDASGLSSSGSDLNISLCYSLLYSLPVSYLANVKVVTISLFFLILFPALLRLAVLFFPIRKLYLLILPMLAAIFGCHRLLRHSILSLLSPSSVAILYVILCSLWVVAAIAIYRLVFVNNISIQRLAVILLSVFCLFTMLLLPPGSGHDEAHHYAFSYKYANMITFKGISDTVDEEGHKLLLMRDEDAQLLKNFRIGISERRYNDTLNDFSLLSKDNSLHEYRLSELGTSISFSSVNCPLGYILPGLGIAVGRLLHLGAVPTFYLGRVFNAVLYIVLVCFAIRIISIGKETLFVLSMFPMVWQQASCYSYDSLIIGIAFIFIAITVNIFRSKEKLGRKEYIMLLVLTLIIASCKYVYTPMVLILLALPYEKFNVKDPKRFKRIIIVAIAVLGALAFLVLDKAISISRYFLPSNITRSIELGHSLFQGIVNFYEMLQLTVVQLTDYYLTGLVAYPGWYQIAPPMVVIMIYYILLLITLIRRRDEVSVISYGTKAWGAIIAFTVSILIALPMAASFTEPDSVIIDGIQGRYFLPLMPMLCMGLRTNLITAQDSVYKKVLFGSGYIGFLFFAYCFLTVFGVI
ncbi:MAG: DUF2142 domain-containing protein [Clostridiales bacterium]|nr:DUF2142 domain-containing protein [Clostridiales bacterium]